MIWMYIYVYVPFSGSAKELTQSEAVIPAFPNQWLTISQFYESIYYSVNVEKIIFVRKHGIHII